MAARKNFAMEQKLAIIAEAESCSITKAAVCRKYGISKSTFDYWKKQLTENKGESDNSRQQLSKLIQENIMLRSIIVDKDLEIAYLKELLKKTNCL